MRKLLWAICFVLALITILSLPRLRAQTTTTPTIIALACANNTVIPTPTSGQYFFVQCNSSGQLLTNALSTTGGTLTGSLTLPGGTPAAPTLLFSTNQGVISVAGIESLIIDVTNFNTSLGSAACGSLTSGTFNLCFGKGAGAAITTALGDVFIGSQAGLTTQISGANVGIGVSSLQNYVGSGAGDIVTAVGYSSGDNLVSGYYDTYLGPCSGASADVGVLELCVGPSTLKADFNSTHTGDWTFTMSAGSIQIASTQPTVASNACGATTQGVITSGSTNNSGSVTVGTAAVTSCTVTFGGGTLSAAPKACIVQANNVLSLPYVSSIATTGFTITQVSTASDLISYICF